jgi:hypothetical protein
MLYLVLVLVIAAFGLLIAALATANTLWAWVSVGISVVAAALLVHDWVRGRRKVAATSAPRPADPVDDRIDRIDSGAVPVAPPGPAAFDDFQARAAAPELDRPPTGRYAEDQTEVQPAARDDAEPGEETTDATDLLVISDLDVEVRVVDEHPRYHLAQCTWLHGRQTIPLPVSEARELGFTPCARCGPDGVLAARHRAGRGATT